MTFINDLFEYTFLARALFTASVVGLVCGVIGSFIILRGLSLMGDAISHAVLPGIALAFMFDVSFFVGALGAGLLAAFGIGVVSTTTTLKRDTSIGIVFTAFLAFGIILLSNTTATFSLTDVLFGNVLAVRKQDMWLAVVIGAVVCAGVLLFYKQLKITTFDPVLADSYGVPVKAVHYGVLVALALVTVASVQTVGVILVVALLITPAATAYLLTTRLPSMIAVSALIGVIAAAGGMYLSVRFNIVSGPAIVLTAFTMFTLAYLFAPRTGVVTKAIAGRSGRDTDAAADDAAGSARP